MPTIRFTPESLKAIKPPPLDRRQIDYWDSKLPRFGLRVSYAGTKTWIISARVLRAGEWKPATRFPIGKFSDMSLSDARAKAREALLLVEEGKDPRRLSAHAETELLERSRNTYGALADEFLTKYLPRKQRRPSTLRAYRQTLKGDDVAHWRELAVADITRRHVRDVLDRIVTRNAPIQANRTLAYLRKFFNWLAYDKEVIDVPPTTKMKGPAAEAKGERVLTHAEIAEIWAAYGTLDPIHCALFKLLLLTGQRLNEIARLTWAEVKGLCWTSEGELQRIPGQEPAIELAGNRTKNGRPHVIPLAPPAVDVLRACARNAEAPYVFTLNGAKPVNGLNKVKRQIDAAIAAAREKADVQEPMPPWEPNRDVRRSVVTGLNELGVLPHVVEAIVNHLSGAKAGVAGVYNRASYLAERRRALEMWANHVTATHSGANVIPLRSA